MLIAYSIKKDGFTFEINNKKNSVRFTEQGPVFKSKKISKKYLARLKYMLPHYNWEV